MDRIHLHLADDDLWRRGVETVIAEFRQFPPTIEKQVRRLASDIRLYKEQLHLVAEALSVEATCASCGGACCRSGKYHFTAIDLLVFVCNDEPLFQPDFSRQGACPYLGDPGCLLKPGFRPFTCITFFCDLIEDGLDHNKKETVKEMEQELRNRCSEVEKLFSKRLMQGLLINVERALSSGNGVILRKA